MPRHALEGTRVVDFSWIVAGPTCTRILADFGAEVIRIEYEQTLDYSRNIPPVIEGASPNMSGTFNNLNRNKLSATLNVMHPKGMGLLHDLIAVSDVVVENYSSSVLERWGLDYESQRRIRPDIIYLSLSGFGHSGPDKSYTTWGPTAQALSGLTMMSGLPGHEPAGWGFSYMDHTAGYYGAMACALAIHHRHRTGEGQWIDLSQVEAGIVLEGTAVLDKTVNGRPYLDGSTPPGNRSPHPAVAPHNTAGALSRSRTKSSGRPSPGRSAIRTGRETSGSPTTTAGYGTRMSWTTSSRGGHHSGRPMKRWMRSRRRACQPARFRRPRKRSTTIPSSGLGAFCGRPIIRSWAGSSSRASR